MSDLIDRQAAIDAVIKRDANCGIDSAEVLRALPSAQPEPITLNIDHELTQEEYEKLRKDMPNAPLMLLSATEPEIIRCKDCKHFEYNHPYIIQGMPVLGHEVCNAWGDGCKTDENGYCILAERRTDEQIW